ncbi:FMN adenylyltransferase [Cryptococcus wingfieldii CBS 7118]|uniref:FAD synthase n=1 Tax=Cryptococcus wingfieldii CBS 7118 TaxID=1295528 RepID=A0A1E3K226_9TREE|nr:FMN adenylyltransferase [Cryptococcus wingfieldii CBS 7118]ODO06497.1 FMN adenylyltransferase [Cryptococcus wingfieldii CBS 7118]
MAAIAPALVALLERAQRPDRLGSLLKEAVVLVQTVLELLGEEAVGISFNGGKDCTVLLHIYAAVLYARRTPTLPEGLLPKPSPHIRLPQPQQTLQPSISPQPSYNPSRPARTPPPVLSPLPTIASAPESPPHPHSTHHHPPSPLPYQPIRSVYITAPNPFPELDEFVLACTERYGLDLWRFGGGMKSALEEWLKCGGGKSVKGVLVGTRQGDPNGEVEVLAHTDPTWPQFLRVHPILHWTYSDVWDFLLELNVPYCVLYDEGFTSLGSTTNTSPNPLLKKEVGGWEPAYKLQDASQERAGRH